MTFKQIRGIMNAKKKRVLTVIRCSLERMVKNMHKSKYIAMVAATAMALTLAGCGSKGGELIEVTPTPMATPTPTVVPATVTPLPTSTPAPKMIGTKTAQAKFVYLTNSLQSDIRELYLKSSGSDEEDWGKNLISVESAVKAAEQVQMYYGGETVTCYSGSNNKTTTCPTGTIDETSKSLIDYHIWNTGAIEYNTRTDTLAFYSAERGNETGKICSSGIACNDTVERTTTWTGYIALPYITDYAYASNESICETNMQAQDDSNNYICKNNNWINNRSTWTWYLTPSIGSVGADRAWDILYNGSFGDTSTRFNFSVYPSIYLKNNVIIESGTGTSDNPYILKAGS